MLDPPESNPYDHDGDPVVLPFKHSPIDEKPSIMELFCGMGGISLGFEMAGFQTVLGTDIHRPAMEVFTRCHPRAVGILGDIRKMIVPGTNTPSMLIDECTKALNGKDLDVLAAGIPCQGFSRMNQRRTEKDDRNYLFLHFMEAATRLRPSFIFIENVPGMKDLSKGKFVRDIKECLMDMEYIVTARVVDASNFHVPQRRKRLFFIARLPRFHMAFPVPRMKKVTVRDALSDLPLLDQGKIGTAYESGSRNRFQQLMRRGNDGSLHDHEAPVHPESMTERIQNTREGKPIYSSYKQRIRLQLDDQSPTIVSGGIRSQPLHYHPVDDRGLTIRERCRLQSIPDRVILEVGKTQGRYLTGNAVPPLLAYHFAMMMKKSLEGKKLSFGLEKYLRG